MKEIIAYAAQAQKKTGDQVFYLALFLPKSFNKCRAQTLLGPHLQLSLHHKKKTNKTKPTNQPTTKNPPLNSTRQTLDTFTEID